MQELAKADPTPHTRFNDAKCDSHGRLWCGTMALDATVGDQGAFYCYAGGKITFNDHHFPVTCNRHNPFVITGKLTKHVSPVSISNGIVWSNDNKTMYYNDSLPKKVYKFDYREDDGTISNQQVFVDYTKDDAFGNPDGMCSDKEGRLWIASFGGSGGINCWDPQTGEHLRRILIPGASNVTSCCFGGPNFEWLLVTSARIRQDPSKYPNAGNVFVVKGLGVQGNPAPRFKL